MFNYKYIVTGNKVIALSTYAGKTVRGVAKCAPGDEFDIEKGKDLATARCAYKIAQKRWKRSCQKLSEATGILFDAQDFYREMCKYNKRAYDELAEAEEALEHFKEEM